MEYFNYCQGLTMTNGRFDELFGGPPRDPESEIEQRHMDLAASIQAVTEEAMLAMGREVFRRTGRNIWCWPAGWRSIAWRMGGCCARGHLRTSGFSRRQETQVARWARRCLSGTSCSRSHARRTPTIARKGSFLGSAIYRREVRGAFDRPAPSTAGPSETDLIRQVVDILAEGKIVGWFQGRMEFGPRALGARSILGDPDRRRCRRT